MSVYNNENGEFVKGDIDINHSNVYYLSDDKFIIKATIKLYVFDKIKQMYLRDKRRKQCLNKF